MKDVKDYLSLPYTKIVRWEPADGLFVASVKEIPGCTAHGDSEASALEMLRDNLEDWISFAIDEGDSIPLPEQDDALPSGKWLQRVPRSLHKLVIDRAALEGVSLNSYVSNTLALAVGMAQREEIPSKPTTIDTLQAAAYAQPLFYGIPQVNLNDWTTQLCIGTPQVATFAAKSPKFGVADLGQIDKPYSIFVDSLVGRLPNRTSLVERIPREDEEEYQDQAYAYA